MATCKQRWKDHKDQRIDDLRRLINAYNAGEDSDLYKKIYEDLGDLNEYGLSLDYVPVGTFGWQKRSFWRFQISYGGPSEEIRFYGECLGEYQAHLEYAEFTFLDWGDGHTRPLKGKDFKVVSELFESWAECGTLHHLRERALGNE